MTASEDGTAKLWPLAARGQREREGQDDRPVIAPEPVLLVDSALMKLPGIVAADLSLADLKTRRLVTAHWSPGQRGEVILWDCTPGQATRRRPLGELRGRPSDVPWAMIFPRGGPFPRHPSQLYQATFEGILLFALLVAVWQWTDGRRRPGLLTGVFCMGYAVARIVCEIFREPDSFMGFLLGTDWFTMGMVLSLPVLAFGAWLAVRAYRNEPQPA